jgi:hypothetical protein
MFPNTSINNPIYRSTANAELIGNNSMKNSLCMQEKYLRNISVLQFRIPCLLTTPPFATQYKSAWRPAPSVIRILDISRLITWKYVPQIAARGIVTMMQRTQRPGQATIIANFPQCAVDKGCPPFSITLDTDNAISMIIQYPVPFMAAKRAQNAMRTDLNRFPKTLKNWTCCKPRHSAQPPRVESDSTGSAAPTSVEAGFRAVALGAVFDKYSIVGG